ncbi:MAG TPA: TA system VapC family ribonuclease toxin [Rhizomicrobium sp.]|nr:TA system VapC family ribonuclease toxin [Rhizomicrobium sp.]
MILIDTNLLVYAVNADSEHHTRASFWLDEQLAGPSRIGLPWHSVLGFVRLVSNPQIFRHARSPADAWDQVRAWLGADNVWIPQPTSRHVDILDEFFNATRIGVRAVMDSHLAALAIEHDLTLCSADGGFARYPKLRWLNPLAA